MPADPPMPRVLIGEADPLCRTRLERLLTGLGYAAESFADGGKALERLLARDAPGIALLDFDLPGKNCLEICHAVRASEPAASAHRCRGGFSPWIIALMEAVPEAGPERVRAGHGPQAQNPRPDPDPVPGNRAFAGIAAHEVGWVLQAGVCDILAKPAGETELRLRLHTAHHVLALRHELGRPQQALGFGASHDPLTGLWNREAFLAALLQETGRAQRTGSSLALIAIDIDQFTQCNFERGYKSGDNVLEQLAMRFRRRLRSYDILGRSGEDEFLVALPGCALEDAIAMAERIRVEVMHTPFHARTATLNIRASFGVAQSRGRSPLLVLREAEIALAAAKRSGGDRVRHYGLELLASGQTAVAGSFTKYPVALLSAEPRSYPNEIQASASSLGKKASNVADRNT